MTRELWTAVDHYFDDLFIGPDPILDAVLAASAQAGLPAIQVSPSQGKFLSVLARSLGARHILEVGTLGGYSTIWLARALPADGRLITLEANPKHATVARANFARAGLDHLIELRLGSALDTLPQLAAEKRGPFDFIFLDADKPNITAYFEWALKLARRGSLIVADNVVREGKVLDANNGDSSVQSMRRFFAQAAADPRVDATVVQTVGSKGYDGLAILLVKDLPE